MQGKRLIIFAALLGYPVRFLAQRQGLQLGKINEAPMLLCPFPEFLQIDHTEAARIHALGMDRHSTVFHPAFHLVAVRLAVICELAHQLVEGHIVTGIQHPTQPHSGHPDFYGVYRAPELLGDSRNRHGTPMIFQVLQFFRRPGLLWGAAQLPALGTYSTLRPIQRSGHFAGGL